MDIKNMSQNDKSTFLDEMIELQVKLRENHELRKSDIEKEPQLKPIYAVFAVLLTGAVYLMFRTDNEFLRDFSYWLVAVSVGIAVISYTQRLADKKTSVIESEREEVVGKAKREKDFYEVHTIINSYLEKESKASARGGALSVTLGFMGILLVTGLFILMENVDSPSVIALSYAVILMALLLSIGEISKYFRGLKALIKYKREYKRELAKYREVIYHKDFL